MLSVFFKKLLFARQLYMIDGRIEILGNKNIMFPAKAMAHIENDLTDKSYKTLKGFFRLYIKEYSERTGMTDRDLFQSMGELYETFGLGTMNIIEMDTKKKKAIIRVQNLPYVKKDGKSIVGAIISGMFSYILKKDVDADNRGCDIHLGLCEFMVQ